MERYVDLSIGVWHRARLTSRGAIAVYHSSQLVCSPGRIRSPPVEAYAGCGERRGELGWW